MRKLILTLLFTLLLVAGSFAAHIKGGFFTYKYLGPGAGTNLRYQITLTVYMICNPSAGQLNNPINFSIFSAGTNTLERDVSVPLTRQYNLGKVADDICITGDQSGCYYTIVIYDLPSVELPATPDGYIVSYQRCCRIQGIVNVTQSQNVGNTFTIKIPGTGAGPGFETNSSPTFLVNDTAVVCRNSFFMFSFAASDPDRDSLSYTFCSAYSGGDQNNSAPPTAAPPPYLPVPYNFPYSGSQPLGPNVSIDRITGIISGIAPGAAGQYVICVCVNEYRNRVLVSTTRKELHVTVGDCTHLQVQLNPKNTTCDGFTVNFQNDAPGNNGQVEHLWIFGDPASGSLDTSISPTPTHTFTDTGVYVVRLKVSLPGGNCADSSTQIVRVYPGFFPGFIYNGSCFSNPYSFTDTTKTNYGVVDSWSWNFGDLSTLADTAHIRNPTWNYSGPGTVSVQLIVTNSKGCIDTALVDVPITDKPSLSVAFQDTLVCKNDPLQLQAIGTGIFSWTPLTNIVNANTANPTVTPPVDTWYYVNMNDNGCLNRDSVHVRVVSSVTARAMKDTTICEGDPIQLRLISDGLNFSWTVGGPGGSVNDPNIREPIATTTSSTPYYVLASIGSCIARDTVQVTTIPYPGASLGADKQICYNTSTQLNATIVGNRFTWTPTRYLSDSTILNPVSSPPRSTTYILSVYDNLGCPKPGKDTITVIVNPKIRAFAGSDTTVVIGQPLQFQGFGGVNYVWSPSTGLNNTLIPNPVGIYNSSNDSVRYKMVTSDAIGCSDSAYVTVYIFQTLPYVFVPTAFTPNGDGLNDIIRPIAVGIQKINYFSIYNRWGQMVYYTTQNKTGWDGRLSGKPQASAVYVWMLSAIDYLGKPLFLKGTVTLIR